MAHHTRASVIGRAGPRILQLLFVVTLAGLLYSACEPEHNGQSATDTSLPPAKQTGNALTPSTPTPMPPVGPGCPLPAYVCANGLDFDSALPARAASALVQVQSGLAVVCPDTASVLSAAPVCNAAAGQRRSGFAITGNTKALVSRTDFLAFIDAGAFRVDATGRTPVRVSAVGCPGTPAVLDCSRWFAVAFGPPKSGEGSLILLFANDKGEGIEVVGARNVVTDRAALGGEVNSGHPGTDLPPTMWFIPWDPNLRGP